jgi:hypothetical protein
MKKRRSNQVAEDGVAPGAVVTVKMDHRDISHAVGVVGIIIKARKSGGILVCSEYGILAHGKKLQDFWIPVDRYRVSQAPNADAVLTEGLDRIRTETLEGNFNRDDYISVTLQQAHRHTVGHTPVGKGACRCKGGNCTRSCGCWSPRNGSAARPCSSSCSCNGNCNNPNNTN